MKKPKSKTPSFITELPLKTTSADESTILVRLDAGRQLYHACLGEGLERLALIQQSKEYQEIQKLPKTIDGIAELSEGRSMERTGSTFSLFAKEHHTRTRKTRSGQKRSGWMWGQVQ